MLCVWSVTGCLSNVMSIMPCIWSIVVSQVHDMGPRDKSVLVTLTHGPILLELSTKQQRYFSINFVTNSDINYVQLKCASRQW